jgi:hypothetical protein
MSLILHQDGVREHPELSLLDFDPRRLLGDVRSGFPALASRPIEVWLHRQPTLACLVDEGAAACIHLHSVLNHPQTPPRVMAFILRHELLHLLVPPRTVNGKWQAHPPEFWEAEKELCPDRVLAWRWITLVLGGCLRQDKRKECNFVKASWKRLMNGERPTLDQIAEILESRKTDARSEGEPLL